MTLPLPVLTIFLKSPSHLFWLQIEPCTFNHRIGTSGEVDVQDAEILKRIAYQTCVEGLMPDTTTFLEYEW